MLFIIAFMQQKRVLILAGDIISLHIMDMDRAYITPYEAEIAHIQ